MVGGCEGGTRNPELTGTARVITRKFVSCPVIVRILFVIVARRDRELVQDVPLIETENVLPPFGVGEGAGTLVKVTLKAPSVIDLVPLAPEPATATSVNENVPEAPVEVSEFSVIV